MFFVVRVSVLCRVHLEVVLLIVYGLVVAEHGINLLLVKRLIAKHLLLKVKKVLLHR